MSRVLSAIGILATCVYVAFLFWVFGARIEEIRSLQPNHMGDFLAGVFGPLAILWLILGFFQQGVELRENSRALDLQAKELQSSTREQRELLRILHGQLETERAALALERALHGATTPPAGKS